MSYIAREAGQGIRFLEFEEKLPPLIQQRVDLIVEVDRAILTHDVRELRRLAGICLNIPTTENKRHFYRNPHNPNMPYTSARLEAAIRENWNLK